MICHYAECRGLFMIILNVVMLNLSMLSVIMLSVVMLSVVAPSLMIGTRFNGFKIYKFTHDVNICFKMYSEQKG